LLVLAGSIDARRLTLNPTAPIKIDSNPRYFNYGNETVALIGISGEFVPQINWIRGTGNTPTTKSKENCGFHKVGDIEKFKRCIDLLFEAELNVMRLWVGLNHSPGKADTGNPFPKTVYTNEQLYKYVDGIWDFDKFDPTYEKNLYDVVQYAQSKGVIVEITLFDPFGGVETTGPWASAYHTMNTSSESHDCNNVGNVQFTDNLLFARGDKPFVFSFPSTPPTPADLDTILIDKDSGSSCNNLKMRRYQVKLAKRLVFLLNGKAYPNDMFRKHRLYNFYWELANEPDGNGSNIQQIANWHYYMALQLREYEKSLYPGTNQTHLIAVNYAVAPLFEDLLIKSGAKSYIDIVEAHYVKKKPVSTSPAATGGIFNPREPGNGENPGQEEPTIGGIFTPEEPEIIGGIPITATTVESYGALRMIREYNKYDTQANREKNNKVWGFNEGRITGFTPPDATPASARAEAWEFMLSGGGVFDHMGFNWGNLTTVKGAEDTRTDLRRLNGILNTSTLKLQTMQRDDTWINHPVYGAPAPPSPILTTSTAPTPTPTPTPNLFYAAMKNENTFLYYRHNSRYSDNGLATKYDPVFTNAGYKETVQFRNTYNCRASFTAEWITPKGVHLDMTQTGDPVPDAVQPAPTPAPTPFTLDSQQALPPALALVSPKYNYDIALKVTKTALFGCPAIRTQTGANFAASAGGATATASSELSEDYPASSVIDGDRSGINWGHSGGWSDATAGEYPDWVQVNYAQGLTINEVDIFTLRDNYTDETEVTESDKFSLYGVMDLELQYRDPETQDWITIPNGVMAGNQMVWTRFTFDPIFTDAIRVVVNRGAGYESPADDYSRIVEIETYNNEETSGEEATLNFR
jgi:hypothetical protein